MTADKQPRLIYIHDPMCSWCWGFSRAYRRLVKALPKSLPVARLLGGLAPDCDQPMPADMQLRLQQTWKTIAAAVPGTRFNYDFWTHCHPRRSTYPACRAVIAARNQGAHFDTAMTTAIQHGYYLHAKNPSDDATLLEFAEELGLNTAQFAAELTADSTNQQLQQEIATARKLGVYGFPALVLVDGGKARSVAVRYDDGEGMVADIEAAMGNGKPPGN